MDIKLSLLMKPHIPRKHRLSWRRRSKKRITMVSYIEGVGVVYSLERDILNDERLIRYKFIKRKWTGAAFYDSDRRRFAVMKAHERQQNHKKFRFGWEYYLYRGGDYV